MRAFPNADPAADVRNAIPVLPFDPLLAMIVGLLAPLFLAGCSGDLGSARLAAIETLAAYQGRTQAELLKIAQIIGFGLSALDCLRLSTASDVPLSMALRLRGCANALNRSAQQNTRALEQGRANSASDQNRAGSASDQNRAGSALDQNRANSALEQRHGAGAPPHHADAPAARPDRAASIATAGVRAPGAPAAADRGLAQTGLTAEQRRNRMWADAMIDVAAELNGTFANIPTAARNLDPMRRPASPASVVDPIRPATAWTPGSTVATSPAAVAEAP